MDIDTTQLQHIGSETQYNIFAAELTAMCLSASIAQDDICKKWDIYTDSQAAIQAVIKPGRQSGQSIIKEFFDSIDAIMDEKPHFLITITWISILMYISSLYSVIDEEQPILIIGPYIQSQCIQLRNC
jgi:hypothetical protein